MPRDQYLSYSQIADWLRCREMHRIKWRNRIRPVIKNRAPELGDAVHRCIAAVLKGYPPEQGWLQWRNDFLARAGRDLWDEEIEVIDALEEDCMATVERALKFIQASGLETVEWKGVPMIEQRVAFPLPGWKGFVAVFDWVAKDPTGCVWLVDWKVRQSFQPDTAEDVSLQMMTYQAVVALKGERVDGSRTLQIIPGKLQKPRVNKDGTVSRADVRTDWETYRQTVIDVGGDPNDYVDMFEKLSVKEFQRWSIQYRSMTEVANAWNDIVLPLSREMNRIRPVVTRNLSFINCVNCDVRQLCLAGLRGHDTNIPEFAPDDTVEDEITKGLRTWRSMHRT